MLEESACMLIGQIKFQYNTKFSNYSTAIYFLQKARNKFIFKPYTGTSGSWSDGLSFTQWDIQFTQSGALRLQGLAYLYREATVKHEWTDEENKSAVDRAAAVLVHDAVTAADKCTCHGQ